MQKSDTTTRDSEELRIPNDDGRVKIPEPEPKRTPLPMVSLLIIFLIQFAEPITALVVYPFVNQFVRETGVTGGDERKTGYFAGIIESLFFLAEAATVFYWGAASDRLGRKPILLLGPLGLGVAMLAFGLSSTFTGLVVSRTFQGVFNGNIGVSKTVLAEVTDSTNIADAFALIPVMWGTGSTIAPIIGGVLSEPALRWPEIFGSIPLFVHHPYFLPCAVSALIAVIAVPFGLVGLKETAPYVLREKRRKAELARANCAPDSATRLLSNEQNHNYGTTPTAEDASTAENGVLLAPPDPAPTSRFALSPRILLVYGFVSFVDMCVSALQPLIWSTSIPNGGLGFEPYRIGVILGVWGLLNCLFQIKFLGTLIKKLGPKKVVSIGFLGFILQFLLWPWLRYFAGRAGEADAMVWFILCIQLTINMTTFGAYGGMQIIIVESTSKETLGAANGIAQAVASGLRGVAPSVASSLFSISLQQRLMGGNLVFYVLAIMGFIGLRLVSLLPNSRRA